MPKNINTSATLKQSTKTEAELQSDLEKANAKIKNSKMVEILVPEAYRAAFGKALYSVSHKKDSHPKKSLTIRWVTGHPVNRGALIFTNRR